MHKQTKYLFATIGVLLFVIIALIITLLFYVIDQNAEDAPVTGTPAPTNVAVSPTSINLSYVTPNKLNTVYLCKYEEQNMMYVRFEQDSVVEQYISESPLDLDQEENKVGVEDLTKCLEVYAGSTGETIYIEGFKVSSTGSAAYVGLVTDSTHSDAYPDTSLIMEKDFTNGVQDVLFEKELFAGDSQFADDFDGAYQVENLFADKYLIFDETTCYACDTGTKYFLVYNVENQKHKPLGDMIGDFSYNSADGTIEFKELVVTGTYDPCISGECEIYEPIGESGAVAVP